MTLAEKILARKAHKKTIAPGDIITVSVDHTLTYDLFCPSVVEAFKEMGFKRVWDPNKIAIIFDHLVPAKNAKEVEHFKASLAFARAQGITKVHQHDGICHQLMFEKGYSRPSDVILGTDSHTVTTGAVGAFATGIGYTEMASVWGTGALWLKVPETLRFEIEGELPPGVSAKDLILKIIGDIGHAGATYMAMEFGGGLIDRLSVAQRLTITNMAVEAGAKAGLMAPDVKVMAHYRELGITNFPMLRSDPDAGYRSVSRYDASKLVPMVSCSPTVDNVMPLSEMAGEDVQKAFLGSCTNGRLEDIEIAAALVRGKKIHPKVEMIVTPASQTIYKQAVQSGAIAALVEAGAYVTVPACGLCSGINGGVVADGDTIISSNNRNFLGRMGGATARVILASPASVAASALAGKVADPREFL
jgi:3-isopropylmalate/(R)-2-methylmalate dehydratase large subunit